MKTASVTGPLERLVGRLRAEAEVHQTVFKDDRRRKVLLAEAADEIERLQAANAKLRRRLTDFSRDGLAKLLCALVNDTNAEMAVFEFGELSDGDTPIGDWTVTVCCTQPPNACYTSPESHNVTGNTVEPDDNQ